MKVTDLMIGDWVLQCELNVPVKVQSIMCHYDENIYFYHETREYISNVSKLEPIPLTPEILEKNGFKKNVWWRYRDSAVTTYAIGDGFHIEVNEDGFELVDNCSDDGDYGFESNGICDIKHVHNLQHLMKELEIEKEIIL